jgi:hypothetical protein
MQKEDEPKPSNSIPSVGILCKPLKLEEGKAKSFTFNFEMATMLRLKLQVGLDNFQHILVLTN